MKWCLPLAFVLAARVASAQDVPTQVHLSFGSNPGSEMTVAWRTAADSTTHQVRFGTTAAMGSLANGSSVPVQTGLPGFIHTVALSGLLPGTLYYYECGDAAAGWSPQRTFRTAPAGAAPLVIAAYGDQGTTTESVDVETLIGSYNPDLVLLLGDLSYAGEGTPELWDTWFNLIEPIAARIPNMPALGNHDAIKAGDLQNYLSRFALPGNERWYSFQVGNAHIIALDSDSPTDPGSPQYDWLVNDLATAAADPTVLWKLALYHYSPYSSSAVHPHDGDPVRANFTPVFDTYHVDLALSGHEHQYERSLPLLLHDGVTDFNLSGYVDPEGTIFVVCGSGGENLYEFQQDQPEWSAARAGAHGFTRITLNPVDTMTVDFIDTASTTHDSFGITKAAIDTKPPRLSAADPGSRGTHIRGPVPFEASASDDRGVAQVEFYVDGITIGTSTLMPFSATWDASRADFGDHYFTVIARDFAGNATSVSGRILIAKKSESGSCGLLGWEPLAFLAALALIRRSIRRGAASRVSSREPAKGLPPAR